MGVRLFLASVKRNGNLIAVVVASVLLIGYIGFLVALNNISLRGLHESALEQLRQDTEKRAIALSYFCSERKNDLKDLAAGRMISAFFENKALGMSMEYGLQASLLSISESFGNLLEHRKLGEHRIYTRIVFIDIGGRLLADGHLESAKPEREPDWKRFLRPESLSPVIIVTHDGPLPMMMVSIPYVFKNEYVGQIIAWISLQAVYHLVEVPKEFSKRPLYIVSGKHHFPLAADIQRRAAFFGLHDFSNMETGTTHRFEAVGKDGKKVDTLTMPVSVKGTPLSLNTILPSTELVGRSAPWLLPWAMVALAIFLVGGMAVAFRINTRNLVLRAKLGEVSKREEEINEKNRHLKWEINERKRAEYSLKKAQNDLERRVEERTAKLTKANEELRIEIIERKRAQDGLHREKEKLRILVEELPIGVTLIGKDGHYRYLNPNFIEVFGYTPEDIPTGRDWLKKAYPDQEYRHQVISIWKNDLDALKTEESILRTFNVRCKDGSEKVIHFRPVIMETGEQLVIYEDMTEQKRLEAQLRQAQKMEAIGTLAGGVAHDFNNLLTTIIGNANLALMDLRKDDTLYEAAEDIKKAGERAAALTRQLLAFSRKQIFMPEVLDFNEALTDIEKMLRRLIREDIELCTVLKPGLWKVNADPGQIDQVIMNLVVNAKDAMPQGGKLTIETDNVDLDEAYFRDHGVQAQTGHYVVLSVSDTGIGMDEEVQSRIFEPFFTTKEKGRGTGLGLSTVYGIIKQSGGFVWVYSEPERGSTFKVYLIGVEEDMKSKEEELSLVIETGGSETILIVEDDYSVRDMAQKILERYGYMVLKAQNGEKALKVTDEHNGQIQLMVTDVVMPGMNGRELAKRLHPMRPEMKVIYMSGYTDEAIVHHGVLDSGLNFIEKPFTPKGLAYKVREVLDR